MSNLLQQVIFKYSICFFQLRVGPSNFRPNQQCSVTKGTVVSFNFMDGIALTRFLVKHINRDLDGLISSLDPSLLTMHRIC